jgi:Ca2+/Na+ antiporter
MNISVLAHPDVLGVIIGVIGLVLAYVFYIRSKEKPRPAYAVVTRTLISSPGLELSTAVEILYNGRNIASLYSSMLYFWNHGTKTLTKGDIAPADPIVFHFEGQDSELLEIRSVKATRDMLGISAVPNSNDVPLRFDFLERNDGVAIEVLHAGVANINCSGTIIGIKEGIQRRASTILPDEIPPSGRTPFRPIRGITVLALIELVVGTGFIISNFPHNEYGRLQFDYVPIVIGVAAIAVGIWLLIYSSRYYLGERIPRGLRRIG